MSTTEETKTESCCSSSETEKKPGFFSRLVQKIDGSLKQKAEQKSQDGDCCGGSGKGGKCC